MKSIEDALKSAGKVVQIRGWAHKIRKQKDRIFLILRDSTGTVQAVVKAGTKAWKDASKLTTESALELSGKVRKDKRAPEGYELDTIKIKPIHIAETWPITRDLSEEFLLDVRHLWLRSKKMQAIMKVRSKVFGAIHEFFRKRGFYEFQSPIIIPSGAEEGPTLFKVDYYGKKSYLAQTWQLYAEAAIASLEKIYTVTAAFRAEKSMTTRHLTEYWTAEVETAWQKLEECTKLAEDMVAYICKKVAKEESKSLKALGRDPKDLLKIKTPFPKITYTAALKKLAKHGMKVKWGKDLRTLEERKIASFYDKPLIVTHYPKDAMAFYKPSDPKYPKTALCFDVIAPEIGIEIIGGSERDLDIKELKKSLKQKGEKVKDYQFYLDTRKYGSVPHAGFGLGIERLIQWICKLDTIRDAIAFPRTPRRVSP